MKANGKIWIVFDTVHKKQTKPISTIEVQKILLKLKINDHSRYLLWTPGWEQWVSLEDFLKSEQQFFVVAPAPIPGTVIVNDDGTQDIVVTKTNIEVVTIEGDKTVLVEKSERTEKTGSFRDTEKSYTEILIPDKKTQNKDQYGYWYDDFNAEKIDLKANAQKINLPSQKTEQKKVRPFHERARRHDFKIEVTLVTKNGRAFRSFSKNISVSGTLLEDDVPREFLNTNFDLIIVNRFEKDSKKGRLHFQGRIVGDFSDPKRLTFVDPDKDLVQKLEELLKNYAQYQKKSVS